LLFVYCSLKEVLGATAVDDLLALKTKGRDFSLLGNIVRLNVQGSSTGDSDDSPPSWILTNMDFALGGKHLKPN
jgi:hypothetical protein